MAPGLLLKMEPRLSPSLILGARLLHLSARDLDDAIRRELDENPALERVNEGGWDGSGSGAGLGVAPPRGGDIPLDGLRIAGFASVLEHLESEVRMHAEGTARAAALVLLQRLDPRGYLDAAADELARELGTSLDIIELGLAVLHRIDPPGIGARDLHECLLIQHAQLEAEGVTYRLVGRILTEAWEDFYHHRWDRAACRLGIPIEDLEGARQFIARNFHPYPLDLIEGRPVENRVFTWTDLVISRDPQDPRHAYHVRIPAAETWELRVTESFTLSRPEGPGSCLPEAERAWIRLYVDRARLFNAALNQRWQTLRRIGEFLADYQRDLLDTGPTALRPLTRRQLAAELGLHESTISRAVCDKTVRLPSGRVVPLSHFFGPSLAVQQTIERLLAGADSPISDRQLAADLRSQGLDVARRTVAKYRSRLKIPSPAGQRRGRALSASARSQ
jgi:RNA polymerase sigma-54 factor